MMKCDGLMVEKNVVTVTRNITKKYMASIINGLTLTEKDQRNLYRFNINTRHHTDENKNRVWARFLQIINSLGADRGIGGGK